MKKEKKKRKKEEVLLHRHPLQIVRANNHEDLEKK